MDKISLLERFASTQEQRNQLSHVLDLMLSSENRNILTVSDFMTETECAKVMGLLSAAKCKSYLLYGGYEEAERRCVVFLPDYLTAEDVIAMPSLADITYVTVFVSHFDAGNAQLTHRDVLGALMGLGIERDVVGDIIAENDHAVFLIKSKLADFVKENLNKVGRYAVDITLYNNYEVTSHQDYMLDSDTVASMRLDAVVASVFHLSRGSSTEHITSGLVSVNGTVHAKADATVKVGDKITLRGKGKIVIESIDGVSKKGRIRFGFRKYR